MLISLLIYSICTYCLTLGGIVSLISGGLKQEWSGWYQSKQVLRWSQKLTSVMGEIESWNFFWLGCGWQNGGGRAVGVNPRGLWATICFWFECLLSFNTSPSFLKSLGFDRCRSVRAACKLSWYSTYKIDNWKLHWWVRILRVQLTWGLRGLHDALLQQSLRSSVSAHGCHEAWGYVSLSLAQLLVG